MEISVGDKTYLLGYPTRKDAKNAEQNGLNLTNIDGKVLTSCDVIFYTGLLAKQPDIKEKEAEKILEQYQSENGDINEVTNFLTEQYMAFLKSPKGKMKKAKVIEMQIIPMMGKNKKYIIH